MVFGFFFFKTGIGDLVTKSCLTLCNPRTVARQALLFMGFSRQEYWSGLPFTSPGDFSHPGLKPRSPVLQADSLLMNYEKERKVKLLSRV